MVNIEEYKKDVKNFRELLINKAYANKPIGCKNLASSVTINEIIDLVDEKISKFECSPKIEIDADGYSIFLDIADYLSSLIDDLNLNSVSIKVPEKLNKLYKDAIILCREYRKEINDKSTKEAKQLFENGKVVDAINILNSEISNLKNNHGFYQGLEPSKECIHLLTKYISSELETISSELECFKMKKEREKRVYLSMLNKFR